MRIPIMLFFAAILLLTAISCTPDNVTGTYVQHYSNVHEYGMGIPSMRLTRDGKVIITREGKDVTTDFIGSDSATYSVNMGKYRGDITIYGGMIPVQGEIQIESKRIVFDMSTCSFNCTPAQVRLNGNWYKK